MEVLQSQLLVSLISVLCTQCTLSLIPLMFPASSIFTLFPLAALQLVIVVGLGGFCKRIAGVRASAPAFVFFNILFVWTLYFSVIRQVVSPFMDIVFNVEMIAMIIGLNRIMSLDPGYVTNNDISCHESEELKISVPTIHHESPAQEVLAGQRRAKYCTHCKHYVIGFDHHCPAFGNCIVTSHFGTSSVAGMKGTTLKNVVLGTMLFCLVQAFWQVVFLMWHVYCACFNIKTDEWINWQQYPEFQIKVNPGDGAEVDMRFINPYDRGILRNLKEFVTAK